MFETIALGLIDILDRMDAMAVIGVFALLLLGLFVCALALVAAGRGQSFYRAAPTLLTTLGILGTFLGIAIGLLGFDVAHVEYSIPVLLEGLKLAFITSILGILLGACLRLVLVTGVEGAGQTRGTEMSSSPSITDDLAPLLRQQNAFAQAQLEGTRALYERFAQFDTRLLAALDRHQAQLNETIDGFAAQLSEMGSRQLIIALEQVIRDFNTNLGVQFGENFRRLDGAVAKLLAWQDQYREHLESLEAQLDHAIAGTQRAEESLHELTDQAFKISRHVQDQDAVMSSLRRETMELEALLGAIAELRDRARDAFPAMDRRLKAMLESIEQAVLAAQASHTRMIAHESPPRSFGAPAVTGNFAAASVGGA